MTAQQLRELSCAQNGKLVSLIPENWLQGRTSYGGFSAMMAYSVAASLEIDLPPLKSAQLSFVGPLSGAIEGSARLLRRGRNSAFIASELSCDAGHGTSGLFNFMRQMDSELSYNNAPMPSGILPVDDAPPRKAIGPAFAENLDWRHAYTKETKPAANFTFWVRAHAHGALEPMAELLLIADALPPASLSLMKQPAPLSSMNWMVNILSPEPSTPDGWWLICNQTDYVSGGVASQQMRVWNSKGELMADMLQSVAIFG